MMLRLILLFSFAVKGFLLAQTPRYALVIGNGDYAYASLGQTPINDAISMRDVLIYAGFEVDYFTNLGHDVFNNVITSFCRKVKKNNGVALFYYSGHGVQHNNQNYLVPIGAELLEEDDIEAFCIPINRVVAKMQSAGSLMNLIILDACRSFPLNRGTKNLTQGLVKESFSIPELLIAYATSPGSTATLRGEGGLSLYTSHLIKHIKTPDLVIESVLKKTRRDVINYSNGQQRPDETSNLTLDFFFLRSKSDYDSDGVPDEEDLCPSISGLRDYHGCPDSDHDGVPDNQDKCNDLPGTLSNYGCPVMENSPHQIFSKSKNSAPYGVNDSDFVYVIGDAFLMGNNEDLDDEKPQHLVIVPSFEISRYELTNTQFCIFLNEISDSLTISSNGDVVKYKNDVIFHNFCGDSKGGCLGFNENIRFDYINKFQVVKGFENYPVVMVSWFGARLYCRWLSQVSGREYRLPSEAEWEFAARGGNTTKGYRYAGGNDLNIVAWYSANTNSNKSNAVGRKKMNELGIYDMSGNVWEWCEDSWHESYHKAPVNGSNWSIDGQQNRAVIRGGAWSSFATKCRVSNRGSDRKEKCSNDTGFRLVRVR